MTIIEYEAFCRRCLAAHDWQREHSDLASAYREHYASGGWSEEDLRTLVTLHMLREWTDDLADEELMLAFWERLPVREELLDEVIRKSDIEHGLAVLENIEEVNLSEDFRPVYRENLANARVAAVAASLGVRPGMPEYDEWIQKRQSDDFEGSAAK